MWKGLFFRVFLFPPCRFHSTSSPHSLHFHVALNTTNGRHLGTFEWRNIVTKFGEHGKKTLFFFVIPGVTIFIFLSLEDRLWRQHNLIHKEYRVLPTRYKATHGDNDCSLPLNGGTSKQLIHEQNVCVKGWSVFMGGVSAPSA